ncbi:Bifunctional ATP-dependent dihydroxyacetone kinase/FAD-AMP lyase [Aphelenchoides besseyi]|nr:Bifunctional ATP-dependent dihydroxyacetone kinase/FAD-AMP lyase [Aphelenchoides besseyi]KAI6229568.1 Bifunctional ATP-dependent dihydroxyacetone kinase/FAD-AMP lyase [Aphelenchoides besseyi]
MSDVKKKFCNTPKEAVDDALKGLVLGDDRLQFHKHNPRVILRTDVGRLKDAERVTLAGGGGSGHEPFASGLVGKNSLTAAIAGDIFASPPSSHITDALETIQSSAGTLLFVINYTGDRLHFGMAIERSKSKLGNDAKLDLIYIDDDVALESKLKSTTGGRGLAGALFTLQIAGVMAEEFGAKFEDIRDTARKVVENIGTFGVSLYPSALPNKPPMFTLGNDEMEWGLGIHGEPGCERSKLKSAKEIVNVVLERLVSSKRLNQSKKEPLAVLLNNLGATSQLEMGVLQNEIIGWFLLIAKQLPVNNGYQVPRFFSGTLMTSLDGHGFSVTILKLVDEKWLKFLDTQSHISSLWKTTSPCSQPIEVPRHSEFDETKTEIVGVEVQEDVADKIEKCLRNACKKIVEAEDHLNKLDSASGDGDCGSSLSSAGKAILQAADSHRLKFTHPKSLSLQLSKICEHSVGGTSGALYALFFGSASRTFEEKFGDGEVRSAIREGLKSIMYYGHAKPNHRTLVDPLNTAAEMASDAKWEEIVKKVEDSAKATAQMEALSGRASYTSKDQQKEPDPGAVGVAIWFRAAFEAL